jgi:peptide/nickel transport system substrate-binding protein
MNSRLEIVPMLVDRWTRSRDRLTYTFTLRRGIKFHDGTDLTSEDVVASLTRWGRVALSGRRTFAFVDSVTAPDPLTVVIRLREPYALLLTELGSFVPPMAVIYPKEVVKEAGVGPIRRFIGTGPYRFVEHVPDRHIQLDRFEGYRPRAERGDGFAGRKEAHLSRIYFHPVPDAATRIAGVRRGDYHIAMLIPADDYDRLQRDPTFTLFIDPPIPLGLYTGFNMQVGVMTDVRIRQAFNAALDNEAIMRAAIGNPRLRRVEPGLMPREHPMWTDAGREFFNVNDPARARRLLQEAGYRGQPLRWLTTMEIPLAGISAQVAKPMLERVGFNVELQFVDWATLLTRRGRLDLWDVFSTGLAMVPDPTFLLSLSPAWAGRYESRDMQAMLMLMRHHTDPRVRMDIWKRAQRQFYKDMPGVQHGFFFLLTLGRRELKGYTGWVFWNAWLSR